jgi:hypothetical protein
MSHAMSCIRFGPHGFAMLRDGALSWHALDGDRRFTCDADDVADIALIGGELWSMRDGALVRRAVPSGDVIASTPVPHRGAGRWVCSPNARVATWLGGAPCAIGPDGVLTSGIPDDLGDLALPLTDTRWLIWRQGYLWSWRSSGIAWRVRIDEPASRLVDAHVLQDGRLVALAIQPRTGNDRRLVVVAAQDGAVLSSMGLARSGVVRVAGRRGSAVAAVDDRLTILDLRFGRVLGDLRAPVDLEDIAIDDAMQHAVLVAGGEVVAMPFAELEHWLVRGAQNRARDDGPVPAASPADPDDDDEAPGARDSSPQMPTLAEPTTDEAPAPEPAFPTEPLWSLDPARDRPMATAAEVRRDLEVRLDLVAARVALAIAESWDSGRITAHDPDEPPFAREVAGLLRIGRGLAEPHLAAARRRVEACQQSMLVADRSRAPRLTPRDELTERLGLSPIAVGVLLVAAAPLLRGELPRLFAILGNDPARQLCDELLIAQVLGAPYADAVARELDADQPLRRYGLVTLAEGVRPFASITVDPLVVRVLRGLPVEFTSDSLLRLRRADRTLDQIRAPRALIATALRELARRRDEPVRIAVRGRVGSGRHTLLAAVASFAGRTLAVIEARRGSREPARAVENLRVALRRALFVGWVPCVDGLDQVALEDSELREQIATVLREHPGPIAVRLSADAVIPLPPGYIQLDLPAQSELERQSTWDDALARHGIPHADAEDLAGRYRVGPGVVERVVAEVAQHERLPEGTAPSDVTPALDRAVRQHLETRLGAVATRVRRLATWSDVVLPDDILDSLVEITGRVRHRKTVFESWGFDRSMTTSRGITALFQGGPGTGKTMVAGVLARDLGLELYRIDVSRITSKWIGETEKNLASLFDAAEDGQVMLLFDEADSLFAKRTEVRTSVDRYANMEVNYLLQRLDSFEGIAILTTNFGTAIDPAFKRRMSFRVTFPFPDEDMRERLWKSLLPPELPRAGSIDFASLARRFKLSGGYIRNSALRAAFLAAEEGTTLAHEHVERAIRAEFREIGKLTETGTLE